MNSPELIPIELDIPKNIEKEASTLFSLDNEVDPALIPLPPGSDSSLAFTSAADLLKDPEFCPPTISVGATPKVMSRHSSVESIPQIINPEANAAAEALAASQARLAEVEDIEVSIDDQEQNGEQEGENVQEPPAPVETIDREKLIAEINEAIESREKLKITNLLLQHKLAEYYKKKKDQDEDKKGKQDNAEQSSEQDQKYMGLLTQMSALQHEFQTLQDEHVNLVGDIKSKSTLKMEECRQKLTEYSQFRASIALTAENTRTGEY